MEIRDKAYNDFKKGMKYKDIAEKYGVTVSAVKSWASRHWKSEKVATKSKKVTKKGCNPTAKKSQPKRMGPPFGNKNAAGSHEGAPKGNKNAYKHGAYSAVYWDFLSDEEKEFKDDIPVDEEIQLEEQIKLLTIRERRLLKAIQEKKEQKAGQVISCITRSEDKRTFKTEEDKQRYEDLQREKVDSGKKLPGDSYRLTTITENIDNQRARMEQELTSVQRAKTKCISELNRVRMEKRRLEEGEKGNELVDAWIKGVMGG